MTKNISIVTIEHKRVKVSVKIDYDNMEVSLVEKVENSNYKAKQFLFAKRGLEYMESWESVIEAQLVAIRYGRDELKKFKEDNEVVRKFMPRQTGFVRCLNN